MLHETQAASGCASPLKFQVRCELEYEIRPPVTLLYNFRVKSSPSLKLLRETLEVTPEIGSEVIVSEPEGNRFDRLKISEGKKIILRYEADVENTYKLLDPDCLRKISPAHLDPAHLTYLLPSRYCQSDRLARFAWQNFGHISGAYDQVLELTKWIHENVEYLPGATTSATSAYDTVTECAGVCRDFAHLGIALCRALNIPARYFTGYAYKLEPPDFHACFEAFIGGYWLLFDATKLVAPNSLVRIGTGRDATDVSVCTAFGIARPLNQKVICEVEGEEFVPLSEEELHSTAFSLEAT